MSRERRWNIYLILFFLVGVALSASLFWSIEQWNNERTEAEYTREALAWSHRLDRELSSDISGLEAMGALLTDYGKVDRLLLESIIQTLIVDDTLQVVAWAPEVEEKNLFEFLATYPEYSFEQRRYQTILPVTHRLFPIALAGGEKSYFEAGLELSQDTRWGPVLETVLSKGDLHVEATGLPSAEESLTLVVMQPLFLSDNQGLGILLAEIRFQRLLDASRDEAMSSLALQVYDQYPVLPRSKKLMAFPETFVPRADDESVINVPLQVGEQRWSLAFFPLDPSPQFSWEAVLAGLFGLVSTLSVVTYCRYLFTDANRNMVLVDESAKALKLKEDEHRSTLARLQKAEARYSDLFERSQALIWTQELDGTIGSLNPAAANSLGYRPDEMKGRSLKDFVLPTERHLFGTYLERCAQSESTRGLLKLYTKNGATRFWMYQTNLSYDEKVASVRCHALDVTESQQAERELERLSRRNELILESVGEGIYGINLAGECTFVNPAALAFTGHSRAELMSAARTMHEILQPLKPDGSEYLWEESASFHTLTDGEIRRVTGEEMVRKDGLAFPVDYVVTPIVEDDNRILGAVVTFQDVTARRAVEQMKNEFISIVSHELRTPLTSIRGSLGLLASGLLLKFPEKADKMLKIAVENTDRLVRLINEILDIERLESGKATIDQQELSIGDLMIAGSDTMRSMATEAQVVLVVQPIEQTVFADSDRILQVLTNLLSNAIKFSQAGGKVSLTAEVIEQHGSPWVQVVVSDTGRGIPAGKREKVFERFGQVDASDSREKGGTGLGLPICKTIIDQHGGSIWVESQEGEGSQFFFTLPVEAPRASMEESK